MKQKRRGFVEAVEAAAARGEFAPITRPNHTCGKCGGRVVVFGYAVPAEAGYELMALPICEVCRIDRGEEVVNRREVAER